MPFYALSEKFFGRMRSVFVSFSVPDSCSLEASLFRSQAQIEDLSVVIKFIQFLSVVIKFIQFLAVGWRPQKKGRLPGRFRVTIDIKRCMVDERWLMVDSLFHRRMMKGMFQRNFFDVNDVLRPNRSTMPLPLVSSDITVSWDFCLFCEMM
jgi:hypothetical protein